MCGQVYLPRECLFYVMILELDMSCCMFSNGAGMLVTFYVWVFGSLSIGLFISS